jgi:hypothetical protein
MRKRPFVHGNPGVEVNGQKIEESRRKLTEIKLKINSFKSSGKYPKKLDEKPMEKVEHKVFRSFGKNQIPAQNKAN